MPARAVNLAFVSGDGLPVSGFMNVLRNVVDIGVSMGCVNRNLLADFGYSWRPDKASFFSAGDVSVPQPDWLVEAAPARLPGLAPDELASRLTRIRREVARYEQLDPGALALLRGEIDGLSHGYREHFTGWLAEGDIDWVIAVNMTLSDAVPAARGLADAVRRSGCRGIIYWDHDLFGTCAVQEPGHGRVYPVAPNELTPVPQQAEGVRWVVATERLRREALTYPTQLVPALAAEVLPRLPEKVPSFLADAFRAQRGISRESPLLLNPVRVFREKGADLAIRVFAQVLASWPPQSPPPCLLVFGSLREDPAYAAEVQALIRDLRLEGHVRLLDGVPVSAGSRGGVVHLSEVELLGLAALSGGGVIFTPSVPDVETIGMGPALAAVARVPALVSRYDAFDEVYGEDFAAVTVESGSREDIVMAAKQFVQVLKMPTARDHADRDRNEAIASRVFNSEPWKALWRSIGQPVTLAEGRPAGR